MDSMKYIIYDNGMYSAPVIFPSSEDHAEFARRLGIKQEDVLSAGMVDLRDGDLFAYGKSHSLDVGSRSTADTRLINRMLGNPDVD